METKSKETKTNLFYNDSYLGIFSCNEISHLIPRSVLVLNCLSYDKTKKITLILHRINIVIKALIQNTSENIKKEEEEKDSINLTEKILTRLKTYLTNSMKGIIDYSKSKWNSQDMKAKNLEEFTAINSLKKIKSKTREHPNILLECQNHRYLSYVSHKLRTGFKLKIYPENGKDNEEDEEEQIETIEIKKMTLFDNSDKPIKDQFIPFYDIIIDLYNLRECFTNKDKFVISFNETMKISQFDNKKISITDDKCDDLLKMDQIISTDSTIIHLNIKEITINKVWKKVDNTKQIPKKILKRGIPEEIKQMKKNKKLKTIKTYFATDLISLVKEFQKQNTNPTLEDMQKFVISSPIKTIENLNVILTKIIKEKIQ